MRSCRHIAVLVDPDVMDLRQRETLRGIARYARDAGRWRLSLDPYAHERRPHGYDGIIATTRKGRGPALANSPVPVVCVSWGYDRFRLARVVENRYAAGRLAARHLVEQGCRAFAYVGFSKQTQSSKERHDFTMELRRRGLRVERARTFMTYAHMRRWWEKVMGSLGEWLGRLERPAGLFIARPGLARSVADLALRRGLRIPDDIAIVAADNDPILCELDPPLTAVHFDYAGVGHRAAELLDRLIDGEPPPPRNVLIPPTLVPRRSTDRLAAGDPLVAQALIYIDRHCTDRLDWRDLDFYRRSDRLGPRDVAAALGVSQRTLEDRFRRLRGRTILQELILARVAHARRLLEHSNAPIPAVARESGFGSYGAMLRAFRRHVGLPPIALRREAERRRRGSGRADG